MGRPTGPAATIVGGIQTIMARRIVSTIVGGINGNEVYLQRPGQTAADSASYPAAYGLTPPGGTAPLATALTALATALTAEAAALNNAALALSIAAAALSAPALGTAATDIMAAATAAADAATAATSAATAAATGQGTVAPGDRVAALELGGRLTAIAKIVHN